MKDLISIQDFSKDEVLKILDTARRMESFSEPVLKGKIMATLFFEPSTRTRLSFESAMLRLGGQVLGFSTPSATSFSKGESLSDAARMIEKYCDIMVVRNPVDGSVKEIADASSVPVINAGDGSNEHPTQSLTDLYSMMKSHGRIDGLSIAMVGDLKYGRTVHSLAKALSYFKCKVYFVSPKELMLPAEYAAGLDYEHVTEISKVIGKVDILYMTRMQKERFGSENYEALRDSFVVTKELIKEAKPDMKIFHPLPRINEIDKEIDNTRHAYYFEEAANGVPVRKALLGHILGVF
jgi:aspartate carbamoyltransferase catalytic subunit